MGLRWGFRKSPTYLLPWVTALEEGILGQRDPLTPRVLSPAVGSGVAWGMEQHWSTLSGQGPVQAIWRRDLGPQVQGLPITLALGTHGVIFQWYPNHSKLGQG